MKSFALTDRRKSLLKNDCQWAGFKVGFSEDNRFAWIIINDHSDARFMKAVEEYDGWRKYECMFKDMVNKARAELRK